MKQIVCTLLVLLSLSGCASVSDSIVSAISQEQYIKLSSMYRLIQDYRFNENKNSLNQVWSELNSIKLGEIFNEDYKAKIIGLRSLTQFYKNNRNSAKSLLRDLEKITTDEELFWIVSALLEKDKVIRMNILLEGKEITYSNERLNSYLAESYLENEMYGEATALYDSILLTEVDFVSWYQNIRDMSFLFMQNPPSSFEYGKIIAQDQIVMKELIDFLFIETGYFSGFNKEDINTKLVERKFFHKDVLKIDDPLLRKDLAYFLFALIADRNRSENLWNQYHNYYTPELSDERKAELEGMSPITDIPLYEYYFYPVLYLIEEEIMELPDGESFIPLELVSGMQLQYIISNMKKRVD